MVNLKKLRLESGLSLRDLKNIVNIDISYLNLLERGERNNISLNYALRLADYYNVDVRDLLKEV